MMWCAIKFSRGVESTTMKVEMAVFSGCECSW